MPVICEASHHHSAVDCDRLRLDGEAILVSPGDLGHSPRRSQGIGWAFRYPSSICLIEGEKSEPELGELQRQRKLDGTRGVPSDQRPALAGARKTPVPQINGDQALSSTSLEPVQTEHIIRWGIQIPSPCNAPTSSRLPNQPNFRRYSELPLEPLSQAASFTIS
jgi:hypothetical protein